MSERMPRLSTNVLVALPGFTHAGLNRVNMCSAKYQPIPTLTTTDRLMPAGCRCNTGVTSATWFCHATLSCNKIATCNCAYCTLQQIA